MIEEPIFKNYKEKQNYYREKYKNRGTTIHISKIVGRDEKVLQVGKEYHSERGDIRRLKRQAKNEMKNNK